VALLQVALDFVDLDRALKCAREAAAGGADVLEAGTPLIKSEGLECVRALRREFPGLRVVADLKTLDAGRTEMECAAKAGAHAAVVVALAGEATVAECVRAGENYGIEVQVDLLGAADPAAMATRAEALGAAQVGVHLSIDEQMKGGADPLAVLRAVRAAVKIPVAVAGGLTAETAAGAAKAGADVLIVGGAIHKASDSAAATAAVKKAIETGAAGADAAGLYRRVTGENLREAFEKVSTPNLSDGAHRRPCCEGLRPVAPGLRLVGRAFTVRAYPGDWSKPVEAIDLASPGDVIVVDAGGLGPALWGELATHSAIGKGIAGVVVDGAVRDTPEIRRLGFPAFSRLVTSNAGEPKGLGETGVPVSVGGVRVSPGDWIVADDDGVMVVPAREAAEMANHAMDCLEKENRIRAEIEGGKTTLGQVTHLLKWEKIG